MRPALIRACLEAGAVLGAGLFSWLGLAGLESALGGGLLPSVLLEEGSKVLILGAACFLGRKGDLGRSLALGLGAIVVFAILENLAYFLAFRSADILLRLLWSEPVHLVSGLAWALALSNLVQSKAPPLVRLGRSLGFAALALAWHLGFNLLAAGLLSTQGRQGPVVAGLGLCNLLGLLALGRYFVQRVVIGGFLYGKDRGL